MKRMKGKARNDGRRSVGATSGHLAPVAETAAYATKVRGMTNYEVLRNVESALVTVKSKKKPGGAEAGKLRVLLDELRWRLSGLEGVGLASDQIPTNIRPH